MLYVLYDEGQIKLKNFREKIIQRIKNFSVLQEAYQEIFSLHMGPEKIYSLAFGLAFQETVWKFGLRSMQDIADS